MELTKDIVLRGTAWKTATDQLSSIFKTRPIYMIFMLSLSIGIMYDQRSPELEGAAENTKTVPRNVLQNNDNGRLDFMFQAAILSTSTQDLTEQQRLDLAFGEKTEFNKIGLLVEFANFGVSKLVELIGDSPLESMENIKNYLDSIVEGRNLDIDALPDSILLLDDQ